MQIYICTCRLTVDLPEDIKIPIESNQIVTALISKSSIEFSYRGLERAITILKEHYAVGTVEVKLVQPKQNLVYLSYIVIKDL